MEPLFAVKQDRGKPPLGHSTSPVPFEVPFTIPNSREHVLNRIGRGKSLSEQGRHLEAVESEDLLQGLLQGICSRLVDVPEPFLQVQEHLPGIVIRVLFQSDGKSPVCLPPVLLGQVPLDVPVLVDATALVDELGTIPVLQGLDDALSSVGHKEDFPGKEKTPPLQVDEQFLADLMIFCGSLPEPQGMFMTRLVETEGNQEGFTGPVDGIDEKGHDGKIGKVPFLETLELLGGDLDNTAEGETPKARAVFTTVSP